MPVVGFRNGKSLKDYLVRAKLPKLGKSGRCEPCGKKTCLVYDSISTTATFTTEACQETFKILKGPLNCDSKKCYTYWNAKSVVESPALGKQKPNFATGSTITTVNIEHLENVIKKFLRNVFTLTIVSMATVELMIGILWFLNNVKHMSS